MCLTISPIKSSVKCNLKRSNAFTIVFPRFVVDTRFPTRGERWWGKGREGVPNIWIIIGEKLLFCRGCRSNRLFPLLPLLVTTFAPASLARSFWGGFNPNTFSRNRASLSCRIKRPWGQQQAPELGLQLEQIPRD